MIKRLTAVAVVSGAVLAATPAMAAPMGVATGQTKPVAKVTILKPLTLLKKADLNFGTILLPASVSGTLSVSMSQGGVLTCATGLVCSGTSAVGGYTVNGTNNQVVTITAPAVTMKNAAGNSIVVTLSAPATATLPNSGASGTDFPVGGSFNIDSTTVDGVYSGDMNVTVDYQ